MEYPPIRQKVLGLIPGQDTYSGCRFDLQSGHVREATNQYLALSLSLSLSLIQNQHMFSGEDLKKKLLKCIPETNIILFVNFN